MPDLTEAPLLAHDAYWSEAVFATERRRVFGRSWLFAGLVDSFTPGHHLVNLAGMTVTLDIHPAGHGARYRSAVAEVDTCGQLLFVRPIRGGPDLASFLAPYYETLQAMSAALTRVDHEARAVAPVNWKVLVENTLDDCHAATVHTKSLQPAMDPDWLARYQPDRHGANSMMGNDLGAADTAFWSRLAGRLPLARHHGDAVYKHLYIFPNFYVATFFGALVMLHRIDPVAPESAALEVMTCLPVTRGLTNAERALHGAVLRDLTTKADVVIAEDINICGLAQRGHRFAVHPGILGSRECRVSDFQKFLRWRIDGR